MKDEEIIEFRLKLLNFLDDTLIKNKHSSLFEIIYSPNLELESSLLDIGVNNAVQSFNLFTLGNNSNKYFEIKIHVQETNIPKQTYSLNVEPSQTPCDVIVSIIHLKLSKTSHDEKKNNETAQFYKDAYILCVCGCDEYLYGNQCPIGSYKV